MTTRAPYITRKEKFLVAPNGSAYNVDRITMLYLNEKEPYYELCAVFLLSHDSVEEITLYRADNRLDVEQVLEDLLKDM